MTLDRLAQRRCRALQKGAAILYQTLSMTAILALAGIPLFASTPARAEPQSVQRSLASFLEQRAQRGEFTGTVIVEHQGQVLLDAGFGSADFELDVPNDTLKVFRIGSVSKPFTAIAILRLQEEGALRLEDRLCRYLRNCPSAWQPVTLRHLLGHTSGIPDLFGDVAAGPTEQMRDLVDRTVANHATTPLDIEPGRGFRYSNFGYLLLAYVCEVASGESWMQVLHTRILKPAGMTATGYDDVFALVPGRVRGYERKGGRLRNIVYDDHGAFAAGGLRSTATDILAWLRALFGGRLLSPGSMQSLVTPVSGDYALGWQTRPLLGRKAVNHSGGIDGFASHVARYLDDQLTVIVLANVAEEPAKAVACDLARIALDIEPPVLEPVQVAAPQAVERLVGTYSDGDTTRHLRVYDGTLVYVRDQGNPSPLVPLVADRFLLDGATILSFDPDDRALVLDDGCGNVAARLRRIRAEEQ
jgi:CubicO group peptidase (beta-lactamase class C family)